MTSDFRALQSRNRWATRGLVAGSFVLLASVAAIVAIVAFGGLLAALVAIALAAMTSFASYRASDTLALRATGARPADPEEFRQLHNVVEEMAIAAGVPKPRVFVVDDPAPNAFATGKDPEHAAIAATTGLLAKMDRTELTGVIAHEMAHVRNLDIRVMTVAVATAGAIAIIADLFFRLLLIGGASGNRRRSSSNQGNGAFAVIAIVGFVFVVVLAPLAATLLKAAVSRSRERLADATAVEFTRHPTGLRRALEKLHNDVTVIRRTSHATSHLWIESPDDTQRGHRGARFNAMFETHPPLSERIEVLRRMEGLAPTAPPSSGTMPPAPPRPEPELAAHRASATSWTAAIAPDAMPLASPRGHAVSPPAGWYPDPASPRRARWWDGRRWSEHTAPLSGAA